MIARNLSDLYASDVMVKNVITITPTEKAEIARKVMPEKNISQPLPVIDARTKEAQVGSITEKTLIGK